MENKSSDLINNFNELYKNKHRVNKLDLSGTEFAGQNLSQLHAENTNFKSCDFSLSDMSRSRFTKCDFNKAVLAKSNFIGSVIRRCVFNGVDANTINLQDAALEDSQIETADFSRAILKDAKLTDTSWSRSILCNTNFNGAKGESVNFRGADLSNSSMVGVKFVDADFRGADLSNVNVSKGDFTGADFRGAILDNMLWNDAQVLGALFDIGFQPNVSHGTASENDKTSESQASDEELAQSVEKIVSSIFSQTVSNLKHDDDLKSVVGKIDNWNKQKKEMDVESISGLVDQLVKSFSGSNVLPPEAISSLKSIFQVMGDTGEGEPSEEIKELLRKFIPEIQEDETGSLDEIVSKYSSLFKIDQ